VPLALSAHGRELWQKALEHAGPGASISELVRWVEKTTGVEIKSPRG